MASTYTTNLGLTLPTTGELAGTWGDVVNVGITALLDSAIAGTVTLSADADVTLSTTNGAANQARSAVILWTASNGATTRNVTAPAHTKAYIVINTGTGSVVIRGVGPTTGVTVTAGTQVVVAWNGTDFVVCGQPLLISGTNIKTINSNSILGSGDLLLVGGLATTPIKTAIYTAVINDMVRVNSTGGAFTVTLPAAPADGDKVGLQDVSNACAANPVLLAAAGGKTVEGDATGLSVNVNGAHVELMYNATGTNWKMLSTPSQSSGVLPVANGGTGTSVASTPPIAYSIIFGA